MLVGSFTVLGASRAVAQTNTIWVDSSVSTPGNGTQTTPYKSLSHALTIHPGIGSNPFTVMVAGNGFSNPDRKTNGVPSDSTEEFPIKIPANVQLVYWDVLGLLPSARPASVVFHPGDSMSPTCLVLPQDSATSGQKGITGYLLTTMVPYPDRNQGFELHEFELAIDIFDQVPNSTGTHLDALLDGVSTFECQKSVRVSNRAASDFQCLVKRSVFRGPSAGFTPISQVVEVVFGALGPGSGPNTPWIEFRKCDLRPTGADLQNSMITILNQGDAEDYLQVLIKNCHVSGQPLVLPIPPNPAQRILGACIEAAWEASSRGRVTVEDCLLWDAVGDGILGSVQGGGEAQGEITIRGCDIAFHGDPNLTAVSPAIAAAPFSGAGIHLAAREKGDWLNVDLHSTESLDKHRHGAFLELGSFPDEDDAFRNVDVNYCNFSRNGLELVPVTEGHGIYVDLKEAAINIDVHRSLFAGNHTTGIKAFLRNAIPSAATCSKSPTR